MTCNNVILAQPQALGSVSYTIPEGDSARLNFGPEDISGLRLGDSGQLVISFADGGELTITNFQDLVNSDSLLYLADGTLVDPSILTSSLQSPDVLAAQAPQSEAITISQPTENTKQEISLAEGQKYICDFDPNNMTLVEIIDGKMVLTFADGSQVILDNYSEMIAGELPPEITLADGTVIDGAELLTEVVDVANIEPAAGEESEEVVDEEDMAALAEQLAEVQPAAGETGGKSNSGYGFNSMPSSDPLDSPDAIGPLNPTQLQYNAPQVSGENALVDIDDRPIITQAVETIDETALLGGNIVVTGSLSVNYGNDTPGVITTTGTTSISGSLPGGVLSSGGVPVVITSVPGGYVGTAGAVTVFTLDVTASGGYTYTQIEPFDHADGTNANDIVSINFGVLATDADGDRTPATIRINVADDAPVILSQIDQTVDETDFNTGNLVVNGQFHADLGQDVVANEYSANGNFNAVGSVDNGVLASNGVPVTVAVVGNVYTGTAGGVTIFTLTLNTDTGEYVYEQFEPLDHADANDTNDQLSLQFGINITDFDGDTADGYITVNILDDAPELSDAFETIDEDNLSLGPIVETGTVAPDFKADGAGAVTTTGSFVATGSLDNGALSHNGVAITVTSTPNGYVGVAGTLTVFTLDIDPLTGEYTFTQFESLDHADNNDANDVITLTFGAEITDYDGDTDTSDIVINIVDSAVTFQTGGPQPDNGLETVDETNLSAGPLVETGTLNADFGADNPGSYAGIPSQVPTGLIHSGVPVTVTFDSNTNTFTGAANGTVVFTLVIDGVTGDYTYTQVGTLDHPDGADHNDVLTLEFGVIASDSEGEGVEGSIVINVLDDGPVAEDDSGSIREGNTLTGNVVDNDDAGADLLDAVTQVTFNGVVTAVPTTGTVNVTGAYGVLTIAADGSYSYTPNNNDPDGVDNFTYTIRDKDGDTDDAVLSIDVSPDYAPIDISGVGDTDDTVVGNAGTDVENGTITVNYRGEGPGTTTGSGGFSSGGNNGGNLTHNGVPVTVTFDSNTNTYTGLAGATVVFTMVINANNSYTFTQLENLDHSNTASANEALTLNFGVIATDIDGDTGTGNVVITVRDDGPDAQNDSLGLARTQTTGSGNVLNNDDAGADNASVVVTTPGIYVGNFGTLSINTDGTYVYTRSGRAGGVDTFNYTMRDGDGDTDTATLTINVAADHDPINISGSGATDDSALVSGPDVETGTISVNYQGDGPGITTGNGNFSSGGSLLGGALSHNGVPVNVTFNAGTNTYTGTSGSVTVFTMVINANGTYTFRQLENMDHGNVSNNNEALTLNFGVRATDSDGDAGHGTVTITVRDDGPDAVNDTASVGRTGRSATGNVLANDSFGEDGGSNILTPGTYNGNFGTLVIGANGSYTYTRTNLVGGGTETFNYTIRDNDGDVDTAQLTINVTANPPPPPPPPPVWGDGDGGDGWGGDGDGAGDGGGSPLVLDLDGDGIEMTKTADGVLFDLGSDGDKDLTAWVKPDDGLLALDVNKDGQINDQSELFGTLEKDGFHVLSEYDSNNDGVINKDDEIYNDLLVWQDLNQDGVSQEGELKTLQELGIQSINLAATMTDYDLEGSWVAYESSFTYEDGTVGQISDVWFQYIDEGNWNRVVEAMGEDAAKEWLENTHSTVTQFIPSEVNSEWQVGDPLVLGSTHKVFEVGLNDSIVSQNGELTVFYGGDEPGAITGNGSFQVGGSLLNGALTSHGNAIEVTYDAETGIYFGYAGETMVFNLQVSADGTYTFNLFDGLDHGNNVNLDDNILLQFGVTVTDADGDSTESAIRLQVRDSGSYLSGDVDGDTDIDTFDTTLFQAINESADVMVSLNVDHETTTDISLLLETADDVTNTIQDFVYSQESEDVLQDTVVADQVSGQLPLAETPLDNSAIDPNTIA